MQQKHLINFHLKEIRKTMMITFVTPFSCKPLKLFMDCSYFHNWLVCLEILSNITSNKLKASSSAYWTLNFKSRPSCCEVFGDCSLYMAFNTRRNWRHKIKWNRMCQVFIGKAFDYEH